MTIKFKSKATGDLVMLTRHAEALMKVIGKEPSQQGILLPEDMAAALTELKALPAEQPQPAEPDEDGQVPVVPAFADEQVSLRQRAWPLIQMIERAQAANEAVVWGV